MIKNKLAIIGANESIVCLINKAKELEYETHVFAWKCGDPGEKIADYFYPINIVDKEKILEKCKDIGICGVCSITSDFAVPTVNYIARNLNLIGNSEVTDIVARNKYKMRKQFKEAGLYSPNFIEVDNEFDINLISKFNFPVIVKPTDRWSSKGITRVNDIKDLKEAMNIAINESFEKKAIIEEFMEGPEYSAECIVFNGECTILAFTQKVTTGYPHYIEIGHIQPSNIPFKKQKEITLIIKKALHALKIENSAAHAEFRILKDGQIGFMEIGARMGGDCIGTDLTPISTGMDYVRMVIDVACGNKPCFDLVSVPKAVTIKFILSEDDYNQYLNLKNDNIIKIIKEKIYDLNFDKEVVDSSTRHGYYIL